MILLELLLLTKHLISLKKLMRECTFSLLIVNKIEKKTSRGLQASAATIIITGIISLFAINILDGY